MDLLDARDKKPVEALLHRMGAIPRGRRTRVFARSATRPNIAEWLAEQQVREQLVRVPILTTMAQIFHNRLATLGGDDRSRPVQLERLKWSENCEFSGMQGVPAALRPRVVAWLKAAHHAHHLTVGVSKSQALSTKASKRSTADRGWWPASDALTKSGFPRNDVRGNKTDLPWPADIDDWIDLLISRHNAFFAAAAGFRVRFRYPKLWEAAEVVHTRTQWHNPLLGLSLGDLADSQTAGLLAGAIWRRTVQRRTWEDLDLVQCPVCGEAFNIRECPYDLVVAWGADRWCGACRSAPYKSADLYSEAEPQGPFAVPDLDEPSALESIRHMATIEQYPRVAMPKRPQPEDLPPSLADAWLFARIAMPNRDELSMMGEGRTWTQWLQKAGVLGPAVRVGRGTLVTARDGHRCRSMFELAIDDFLSAHDVEHVPEPDYPWHATLNPSGTRRADWLLPGRTVVEAAGLSDHAYSSRLAEKQTLAHLAGFTVITILPREIDQLLAIFREHLSGGRLEGAAMETLPTVLR